MLISHWQTMILNQCEIVDILEVLIVLNHRRRRHHIRLGHLSPIRGRGLDNRIRIQIIKVNQLATGLGL